MVSDFAPMNPMAESRVASLVSFLWLLPMVALYGCFLCLFPMAAFYGCFLRLLPIAASYECSLWLLPMAASYVCFLCLLPMGLILMVIAIEFIVDGAMPIMQKILTY